MSNSAEEKLSRACTHYEPQRGLRRGNRCKNCLHKREEHVVPSIALGDELMMEHNDSGCSSEDIEYCRDNGGATTSGSGGSRQSSLLHSDREGKPVLTPRKRKKMSEEEEKYRQKKIELNEKLKAADDDRRAMKQERKEMLVKQIEMREQLIRMEAQLADYEATRLKNDRLQKEMKVMKNDLKTMTIGAAKACDANEMLRGKVDALQKRCESQESAIEELRHAVRHNPTTLAAYMPHGYYQNETLKILLDGYKRKRIDGEIARGASVDRLPDTLQCSNSEKIPQMPTAAELRDIALVQDGHERLSGFLRHVSAQCCALRWLAENGSGISERQAIGLGFAEGILKSIAERFSEIHELETAKGMPIPRRPTAPAGWEEPYVLLEDTPPLQPRPRARTEYSFEVKRARSLAGRSRGRMLHAMPSADDALEMERCNALVRKKSMGGTNKSEGDAPSRSEDDSRSEVEACQKEYAGLPNGRSGSPHLEADVQGDDSKPDAGDGIRGEKETDGTQDAADRGDVITVESGETEEHEKEALAEVDEIAADQRSRTPSLASDDIGDSADPLFEANGAVGKVGMERSLSPHCESEIATPADSGEFESGSSRSATPPVERTVSPKVEKTGKKVGRSKSIKRMRMFSRSSKPSKSSRVPPVALGDSDGSATHEEEVMNELLSPRGKRSRLGLGRKKKPSSKAMREAMRNDAIVDNFMSFLITHEDDIRLTHSLAFCKDVLGSDGAESLSQVVELYNVYIEESAEKCVEIPEHLHAKLRASMKKAAEEKDMTVSVYAPVTTHLLQRLKPHFASFVSDYDRNQGARE